MRETQTAMVLRHLREVGSLSPWEALREYGIMRLGARVWDLKRAGHNVVGDWFTHVNRFGRTVRYKVYRLEQEGE